LERATFVAVNLPLQHKMRRRLDSNTLLYGLKYK